MDFGDCALCRRNERPRWRKECNMCKELMQERNDEMQEREDEMHRK